MSKKIALERIAEAKKDNSISLDLSKLELMEIPVEIEQLGQLNSLYLYNNQIAEIKNLNKLKLLTLLHLENNQITKIENLDNLKNLKELNLSNNRILEINNLDNLDKLSILHLDNNRITEIKNLGNQKKLTILYLYKNYISEIKNLGKLDKLIKLFLEDNEIIEIKNLDKLQKLTVLSLGNNRITRIKNLENLKNLDVLYLTYNRIINLPEYILSKNQPIFWGNSVTFDQKGIYLKGNPFTNPPISIIIEGNQAIKEYFAQRKKGEELLLEAKLILLGDGRSGKTSLANRLLGKDLPKEADRTQGVDIVIGEYEFPLANGKTFKLNIWDFAGQDKYKTLHQLFYTESSVYVMVAESGNARTDFDDWLQTAALFGEGSPLLIALNEFKAGIGMGTFDEKHWKKQFPDLLKEVYTVNLLTKDNVPAIEKHIQLLAQNLPHTKYAFPSNWAAIRRVLNERREEQYISLKEYLKICKANNLPKRESALILSSVLHKIGACLHYQKSDLLKQIIILKNEWATDAVYKILEDTDVAEKKCGFFDKADTHRIWADEEYQDMRPQLLELMQQFKLAYQLPGKEEYVTPPLLPPARPAHYAWSEGEALELYIDYDFLPKALMTQFIVTRHADIAEKRTLVWRNGVVLEWEGEAYAEVAKVKLHGKDAFHIRSQGTNRKGMMTVILKTYRTLHSEYKGIKCNEKVPCNCEGCTTKQNKQHYFDLGNLTFRIEKGREKVECDKSLEEINILALLENSFVLEKMERGTGKGVILKNEIERQTNPSLQKIKIFLASSNELAAERTAIEKAINRKNKTLVDQGLFLHLSIWEDGKVIGKSFRSQDNYNEEINACDIFVLLFYSKIGKYSLEEYQQAKKRFDNEKIPRLIIGQKDIALPANQSRRDANSRFDFIDILQKESHFPELFKNEEGILNIMDNKINQLLADKDFMSQLEDK